MSDPNLPQGLNQQDIERASGEDHQGYCEECGHYRRLNDSYICPRCENRGDEDEDDDI